MAPCNSVAQLIGVFLLFCVSPQSAKPSEWGTLKGQVLADGEVPSVKPLVVKGDEKAKDSAVCAAEDVPDEKLIVNARTNGIANVVVYLQTKPAKIHPDLEKSAVDTVEFEVKGCRFRPHFLIVRTDQQIRLVDRDAVAHNVHDHSHKNIEFGYVVPPKDPAGNMIKPKKFAEKLPVRVSCDIHPWMKAYLVILDHPYVAVTDANGDFEIPKLPVGSHEFTVWQESVGYLEKRLKVEIKPGVNQHKLLKYTAEQFQETSKSTNPKP